jgi:hypothetical protein
MNRIDHVVLSDDASKMYAVQGELNSPFKSMAEVDVVRGLNTPLAQSTQVVDQHLAQTAAQGHAQQQGLIQQQAQPTPEQAPPQPHAPAQHHAGPGL